MDKEKEQQHVQSMWVKNAGRGGALTWLLQRLTGLFIVAMILLHFGINHLIGTGTVTYQAVFQRLSHPLWKCFDMAFLSFALYHGLAGLWVVAADYVKKDGWRTFVYTVIIFAGAVLFCLGTITIVGFPFN